MHFLVIIDMQPCYPSSQSKTLINNIRRKIFAAKRQKHTILVVEYKQLVDYELSSRTDSRIMSAIGDYKRVIFVQKNSDNGGPAIKRALSHFHSWNKIRHSVFHISGVNANACVLETVDGLSRLFTKSEIRVLINCVRSTPNRAVGKKNYSMFMPKNAVVV